MGDAADTLISLPCTFATQGKPSERANAAATTAFGYAQVASSTSGRYSRAMRVTVLRTEQYIQKAYAMRPTRGVKK